MVQFEDGSIKAQMGLPDMKLPIQYALAFPQRIKSDFPRYDFRSVKNLSFEEPDVKTFRNLALAQDALEKGGNLACVMNAANEIVVYAFLKNRINFLEMTDIIERTMQRVPFIATPTLEDYFESDAAARTFAADQLNL
jgi:1-deoxy-D-xylulose-5-phosphate reductoisomerase